MLMVEIISQAETFVASIVPHQQVVRLETNFIQQQF